VAGRAFEVNRTTARELTNGTGTFSTEGCEPTFASYTVVCKKSVAGLAG
jgi:hypothetical protein